MIHAATKTLPAFPLPPRRLHLFSTAVCCTVLATILVDPQACFGSAKHRRHPVPAPQPAPVTPPAPAPVTPTPVAPIAPPPVSPVLPPDPLPAPFPLPSPVKTSFSLNGLISPATVAESIFIEASSAPSTATVSYYVDDKLVTVEAAAPFWMGGQTGTRAKGFSVASLDTGQHTLRAVANLPDGTSASSNTIVLNVVPSINGELSAVLGTYANQPSAQQQNAVSTALANVSTQQAAVTATENAVRQAVLTMYLNWNIDPSLDAAADISAVLSGLAPKSWAAPAAYTASTPLSMAFSPDAPYYHAIPTLWPRVALPSGYIQQLQVNSVNGGDGIGYGESRAAASDPQRTITSEWYSDASTLKTFSFRMNSKWTTSLPTLTAGDSHMIFVDPVLQTFVSTYKTTVDGATGGPDALYASAPTPFNSLGDHGGSNAAGFADAPVLIQPGEVTDATRPILHAIGGPVGRTWAARVYPATSRDAGIKTSLNSCTGSGLTNNGLVPYGGVIQLDPKLDLTKLSLSLPALRILQAMQTYGYYVMDFGCGDMDIYTSIAESEVEPYGGMYGNVHGPGVQFEVQNVLTTHTLYVVAPLLKKQ